MSQKYPETKVLLEFSDTLHNAIIEPIPFASKLYSQELIDRQVYRRVSEHTTGLSKFDKAVNIVSAIEQTLQTRSNDSDREEAFKALLLTMGDLIPLDSVAENMDKRYKLLKATWKNNESTTIDTVTPITQDFSVIARELTPASDKWRALGVALKVPFYRLNSIGQDKSGDDVDKLMCVLEHWGNNAATEADSSWEVIINALRSPMVERGALAETLKKKYVVLN